MLETFFKKAVSQLKQWLQQSTCNHCFRTKTLISTSYNKDGTRYRTYKCVCCKCNKIVYERILY